MIEFIDIDEAGRTVRIEYQWVGSSTATHPLIVFLHEGLGSVAMWRDFPAQLCAAVGCRGLVYSRPGYGQSTPRPHDERWHPDFMHRQAHHLLPDLLHQLGIDPRLHKPWLLGHSDGGSIALLHAARFPQAVAGVIALAPHIMVEEMCVRSIAGARLNYETTDMRQRLARYHADPDSAFWGWATIWLDGSFATWSIEDELSRVTCPLLAIQGLEDEYGTLEQIRGIARRAPQTQLLELAGCGHIVHRDQPQRVIDAVRGLIAGTTAAAA